MNILTPPPSALNLPDDWEYRDIPLCAAPLWNELLDLLKDDCRVLASSSRLTKDEVLVVRGQMFISPAGMKNLLWWKNKERSVSIQAKLSTVMCECGNNQAKDPHCCPYADEIDGNSDPEACTCCADCENDCCREV